MFLRIASGKRFGGFVLNVNPNDARVVSQKSAQKQELCERVNGDDPKGCFHQPQNGHGWNGQHGRDQKTHDHGPQVEPGLGLVAVGAVGAFGIQRPETLEDWAGLATGAACEFHFSKIAKASVNCQGPSVEF